MATDAERYLRKSHESLASAKADVRARRYNSAANRAYYAAFQAAVAALLHWRIRGTDTVWEHRFVPAEFADKLIRRRKVLPGQLRSMLAELFKTRITADYELDDVTPKRSTQCVRLAATMVEEISQRMSHRGLAEEQAPYETTVKTKQPKSPLSYVEDVKGKILSSYPDVDFRVRVRSERDFTLDVYGDYADMWEVTSVEELTMDILEFHDVWIVVLPHEGRLN